MSRISPNISVVTSFDDKERNKVALSSQSSVSLSVPVGFDIYELVLVYEPDSAGTGLEMTFNGNTTANYERYDSGGGSATGLNYLNALSYADPGYVTSERYLISSKKDGHIAIDRHSGGHEGTTITSGALVETGAWPPSSVEMDFNNAVTGTVAIVGGTFA